MIIPGAQTVMIVDDSLDILTLNTAVLEMAGYQVVSAACGSEGLAILSKSEAPDLLLLDMNLGDMSGSEFLQRLERLRPEILEKTPVVYFTGMNEPPQGRALGIIQKPVEIDKLEREVRRFIELGNAGAEPPCL